MSYTCTWGLPKWLTWSPLYLQILSAKRIIRVSTCHHKCAKFVWWWTMFSALMLQNVSCFVFESTAPAIHCSTDFHFETIHFDNLCFKICFLLKCIVLSRLQWFTLLFVFICVFPYLGACVGTCNREQISLNFCVQVLLLSYFCF